MAEHPTVHARFVRGGPMKASDGRILGRSSPSSPGRCARWARMCGCSRALAPSEPLQPDVQTSRLRTRAGRGLHEHRWARTPNVSCIAAQSVGRMEEMGHRSSTRCGGAGGARGWAVWRAFEPGGEYTRSTICESSSSHKPQSRMHACFMETPPSSARRGPEKCSAPKARAWKLLLSALGAHEGPHLPVGSSVDSHPACLAEACTIAL